MLTAATLRSRARRELSLLAQAYARLVRHGGDSLAAGVAYGVLLSIAPLLVVAVAVASLWVGEGSAQEQVVDLVRQSLGAQSARFVAGWVQDARAWSGTATALGLAGFLYGSMRLVSIVDASFDVVFEAHRRTYTFRESVHAFFLTQLTAFATTLLAFLVLVASIFLRALTDHALGLVEGATLTTVVAIMRACGSFVLLALALGIIYRVLPPHRLARADVVEGSLITALLLEATFWALSFIVEHVDVAAAYGVAGGVVAVLVWLLVASQLFLYGAEITAEIAERRRHPDDASTSAPAGATPLGPGA